MQNLLKWLDASKTTIQAVNNRDLSVVRAES